MPSLDKLLIDLFEEDELRRFIQTGPDGADISANLPGHKSSLATIANATVQLLNQRGLLGADFFQRLCDERPAQSFMIQAVAQAFAPNDAPRQSVPQLWVHNTTDDEYYIGRERDLRTLDRWAANTVVRIIGITALGGMGKTSLVGHWIKNKARCLASDFEGLFAWSFYADSSVVAFLAALLSAAERWGLTGPIRPTETQLTRANALLKNHSVMLLLDGLEVIQQGLSQDSLLAHGTFLDPHLRTLLDTFCYSGERAHRSLIFITSRFPFADLTCYLGHELQCLDLDQLAPSDGAALLYNCGVQGTSHERELASASFDGHPLALRIFAKIVERSTSKNLPLIVRGIIGAADGAPDTEAECITQDQKIRRLLAFYANMLSPLQRAIMVSVSLFMNAIEGAVVERVVACLCPTASPDEVESQLAALAHQRLITRDVIHASIVQFSCHPILKDYFRSSLRSDQKNYRRVANALSANLPSGSESTTSSADIAAERPGPILSSERDLMASLVLIFTELNDYLRADELLSTRLDDGVLFAADMQLFQGLQCILGFVGSPAQIEKCSVALGARRLAFLLHMAGSFCLAVGDVSKAEYFFSETYHAAATIGKTSHRTILPNLARISMVVGDLQRARKQLGDMMAWAIPLAMPWESFSSLSAYAQVLLLTGKYTGALECFQSAIDAEGYIARDEYTPEYIFESSIWIQWASFLLRVGNVAGAKRLQAIFQTTRQERVRDVQADWMALGREIKTKERLIKECRLRLTSEPQQSSGAPNVELMETLHEAEVSLIQLQATFQRLGQHLRRRLAMGYLSKDGSARDAWISGWLAMAEGRFVEAADFLLSAESLFRGSFWVQDLLAILLTRGQLALLQGLWVDGHRLADEVLRIAAPRHLKLFQVDALILRASLFLRKSTESIGNASQGENDLENACDDARAGLALATRCSYKFAMGDALDILMHVYDRQGNVAMAAKFRKEWLEHDQSLAVLRNFTGSPRST